MKGLYALASVSHGWQLVDKLSASAGLSLGYASSDQGSAYWLHRSSGFADLIANAGLAYELTPHVKLTATVYAATIVASDYRDALDLAGIEADNLWLLVGAAWSF